MKFSLLFAQIALILYIPFPLHFMSRVTEFTTTRKTTWIFHKLFLKFKVVRINKIVRENNNCF